MVEVVAALPQRDNQRSDLVAQAFGLAIGISNPETARQRLMRLAKEMPAAIIAHREHGSPERLVRFLAPTELALAGYTKAPVLTPEMEMAAEEKDEAEDLREKAYDLNPCRETAAALVRAIDADTAAAQLKRAAIVALWAL
jgi:hypothetical protein